MVRLSNSSSGLNPTSSSAKFESKPFVVEEKSSKPPGVPKFSRTVNLSSSTNKRDENRYNQTVNIDGKSDAAIICQQLLRDGFVQSYVDFYHLTHRLDPTIADENTTKPISIPIEDLSFIKDHLVLAESARRQGETTNVYIAFNKLADYYVKIKDWKTGFFFHEKCLEVSQLTNDIRAEMSANHSLGVINQLMQNYERARVHHEKHEELASSVDVFEEVARSNAELYKVYMVLAEKFELNGVFNEAFDMYKRCLGASKKSWDKSAEGEANGRLGNLLLAQGQTEEAIPFLKQQSQLAADLGHPESRCRACTALALAYDKLGQQDRALNELTLVHAVSEQSGDVYLQSQACRALGTLYSKVGKLDAAVETLQKHFMLLKQIISKPGANKAPRGSSKDDRTPLVTSTDLDLARTYIGISKGNLLMGKYIIALQIDLITLLDWKLNRSDLSNLNMSQKNQSKSPAKNSEDDDDLSVDSED